MPKNLLIYRLIVQNLLFLSALVAAWQIEWVQHIWSADTTYVTRAILGLFLLGLGSTGWHAWKIERGHFAITAPVRLEHLHWFAEWCTFLGFFGMALGFYKALDGFSVNADPQAIARMMSGIGISLSTTLVGCACGLWTQLNYLPLKTAASLKAEG